MGFLSGGSSQSTSSLVSNIDFSPIMQFGSDQTSSFDRTNEQTATVTPKLDDSLGVAASVGFLGGTAGPATMARTQEEDTQPIGTTAAATTPLNLSSINPTYAAMGVGGIALLYFFTNKKKKK